MHASSSMELLIALNSALHFVKYPVTSLLYIFIALPISASPTATRSIWNFLLTAKIQAKEVGVLWVLKKSLYLLPERTKRNAYLHVSRDRIRILNIGFPLHDFQFTSKVRTALH